MKRPPQGLPRPARILCAATAAVTAAAGLVAAPAARAADSRLLLEYHLDQSSGTVAVDSSGHGNNGTVLGGAAWSGGEGLSFDGVDDYVRLPANLLQGLGSVTVSTDVLVSAQQQTPYFVYGLGNTNGSSGNGYLFTTGDTYRTSITTSDWQAEKTSSSNAPLPRGVWKTLTYTQTGTTGTLYLDGVQVAKNTAVTVKPGDIGGGLTASNFLGRSLYGSDKYFKGSIRDFRIFNTALGTSDVAALVPSDATRVQRDASALSLGDLSAVTGTLSLPASGPNGSAVSWASSNPSVVSSGGTVIRPPAGSPSVRVTLTATVSRGTASSPKQFTATVLPLQSDQQVADAAARALAVSNLDDVRGNLTLPTTVGSATVTWSSADTATVTPTGEVTRGSGEKAVDLTARVKAGSATAVRKFTAHVRPAVHLGAFTGYAFTYFTGSTTAGERIYLAASRGDDALHWDELNGGQPVLTSTQGTGGLRDPFVIRSPEGDTFYLLATDLSIGSGTTWDDSQRHGSQYIEVWESHDLKNWSNQRHVKVSPDTAGNTWAPEAYYDDSIGAYVVFWASKLYAATDTAHTGTSYNRMMYATTRDFVTFTEAKVWNDPGNSVIDSTVIKDNGTYYRFTKDESAVSGCTDIMEEKSASLRAADLPSTSPRNWSLVTGCIGKKAGTRAVEGPTVFKKNDGSKYYLFVDEYGGRGYIPLQSDSLANPNWQVPPDYSLPTSPRHGTVLPVTAAELGALRGTTQPVTANYQGEVVRYSFDQASGTRVADVSGNHRDATVVGGATWSGDGALQLDGSTGYVDLPDNLLNGVRDVTVEADVKINAAQSGNYFLYGLGNTDAAGAGNGYLFATGNSAYRTALATGNWQTEQNTAASSSLPRGTWAHLVYTLQGTTATLYLNGQQVAQNTGVTIDPADIGSGTTLANYIGRSVYTSDKTLNGSIREFALYNRALSAQEVASLSEDPGMLYDVSLKDPSSLKIPPIVDAASHQVTVPVKPGTGLTSLAPTFTLALGTTSSIPSGTAVDLSKPVTYTLTPATGSQVTWTVKGLVMRSPVLPGYTADPNIVVFGDTYYIYPTSDGYASWGSTQFHAYSSKNLVDWTDHGVVLDLADVSWTHANAWAPTIATKNGTYYLYFSAGQNIGVATSTSPTGPFTDSGKPLVNKADYGGAQQIDPAVFTDSDGTSYLFWGNGTARYVPLNADMVSYDATKVKQIGGLTHFREGSFVNKRGSTYYLTYSINDTRSEDYQVGYATAPSINGPWTYQGVVLQKNTALGILGTGHSSIVNIPGTDEWYIAYHRFAIPGGDGTHRETTIDKVAFTSDGKIQPVVPTLESVSPRTLPAP